MQYQRLFGCSCCSPICPTSHISVQFFLCTIPFIHSHVNDYKSRSIERFSNDCRKTKTKAITPTILKGLAKLGNIVAETMFLFTFPWVAKLGNICFGRKICVREAKTFLTPWQKHFLFPSSKICFRNTCFPRG